MTLFKLYHAQKEIEELAKEMEAKNKVGLFVFEFILIFCKILLSVDECSSVSYIGRRDFFRFFYTKSLKFVQAQIYFFAV